MDRLPRSIPEREGISSDAIISWVNEVGKLDSLNSFMLLRNGRVIAEGWWNPYRPEVPHQLFSLSKSFTSLAVGFARAEGLLKLDDPVTGFFPEKLPRDLDERFRRMTVRHLLTMSTGHDRCALDYLVPIAEDGDWVAAFFRTPLSYEPGSRFVYNSGASYLLSAIVTRVTGRELQAYLRPRLLNPLGFAPRRWEKCPRGIDLGGWGFNLTTEEIARFAQMLLDGGKWRGRQLVPPDYLRMATSFQIDNSGNDQPDWKQGYGFQFWRTRHNTFRGDGAFGQYALVMPDQQAVLAVTSGLRNMQTILDAVWTQLLPAFQSTPLPENPAAADRLRKKLETLAIPMPPAGSPDRLPAACYRFEPNAAELTELEVECSPEQCTLTFTGPAGVETLRAGFGRRLEGRLQLDAAEPRLVSACASAPEPDRLLLDVCCIETPFRLSFELQFEQETLRLVRRANLYFHSKEWPELTGRRIPSEEGTADNG